MSKRSKYAEGKRKGGYTKSNKKRSKVGSVAAKADAVLETRGRRNQKNSVDTLQTGVGFSTTAVWSLLNGCTEGAAIYNRIGRRIKMKSIQVRGGFSMSPAADATHFITVMLVYDRQPNGANPAIADLLLDYKFDGTTGTSPLSGLNINNSDRFVVLRRDWYVIDADPAATAAQQKDQVLNSCSGPPRSVDMYVKLAGLEAHYKASTGGIGDLTTGALYLVTYGSQAASVCSLDFASRLRFDSQ